jgi:DNA repair protein RecO (recombination protein O)
MLEKTRGIVLKSLKYSETSLITRVFTERFGQLSFLVPGGRKSKTGRGNLLQPGQLLEIDCYYRENRNFQRFREFKVAYIPEFIHSDVRKFSVLTFLIELTDRLVNEKEENEALFRHIFRTIVEIDQAELSGMFPLHQLIVIAGIMGFKPSNDFNLTDRYFNLVEGRFQDYSHHGEEVLSEEGSLLIHRLLRGESGFNHAERRQLLDTLLLYYQLHIPNFKSIRSVDVLHELLS